MPDPRDSSPPVPGQPRGGPALGALLFRSSLAFSVLCPLALAASLLLLELPGRQGEAFWRTPRVWFVHALCAFLPVLSLASFIVYFGGRKRSALPARAGSSSERSARVLCMLISVCVTVLPPISLAISPPRLPGSIEWDAIVEMPGFLTKWMIVGTLGLVAGLPHVWDLFSIHVQISAARWEHQVTDSAPEIEGLEGSVLRTQRLRSRLKQSFGFITAIMGAATLLLGAVRNLLQEAFPSQPDLLPASFVMAYGLYFTALLAVVYLPVHKGLTELGETLANQLVLTSIGTRVTWKQWTEELQAVRVYLGLRDSALREFQNGIAVFVPLVAGISSLLLSP